MTEASPSSRFTLYDMQVSSRRGGIRRVPSMIAEALRRTSFPDPLMVAAGPVIFDASGENPNVSPAVLQIFGSRPAVVWPRVAAERAYIIPARGTP